MDTVSNITDSEGQSVIKEADNFLVTKIQIRYQGIGLGQRRNVRVLEFPKLLWRKIYSIFTTQDASDNVNCHTISIEGLGNLTKSQVVIFAQELRKQMDIYAGFTDPAESRDYDHTFLVTVEFHNTLTCIISSDVVTRWCTDDGEFALKTWNEWIQLEAIYSPENLLSQLP